MIIIKKIKLLNKNIKRKKSFEVISLNFLFIHEIS